MDYLGRMAVEAETLTVGQPPGQYTFPTAIGEVGEVLTSEGNGSVIFSANGGGTGDHTQLTNIGTNTHSSLDRFKSLIEARVSQDVRALASPSFAEVSTDTLSNADGYRVIDKPAANVSHIHSGADPVTTSGYNIRCAVGSTRINHGSDNTASYLEVKQEEQLFKVAGFDKLNVTTQGVTFNPGAASSYTMPETRGVNGQGLVSDGAGGVNWASAVGSTETMAESFAAARSFRDNYIVTENSQGKGTLFIVQGPGASPDIFETQNEDGVITTAVGQGGSYALSANIGPFRPIDLRYTLPLVRATASNQHIVSTGVEGETAWQGRSYANIYFKDNAVLTPLPVQDQYDVMRGNRLGTFASDFTLNAGPTNQQNLVYTGVQSKFFQVVQSLTWQSESSREVFRQAVFKNGVLIPGSESSAMLDDNNDYPRNATTTCIVELENGDTIAGYVKDVTDDISVLIIDYQLVLTEV
jgi:hypothetical protein